MLGKIIVAIVMGGFLLLLLAGLFRILLSVIGLGRWACGKGWHWDRDFLLHTKQGVLSRTHSYLAVAGVRINQCRTCGRFSPPEGQVVWEEWQRGGVRAEGGGIFTSPTMKVDPQARQAIGATIAKAVAAAPPPKPKAPSARWMVVVGSWPVVQKLGVYVIFGSGILGMILLVSLLKAEGDDVPVLLSWGLGLLAFAWFLAKLMDAGMSRYNTRKLAAEATADPEAYLRRTIELAKQAGVEVPFHLTAEGLAESTRRSAAEK
jgi:hypothetical protein